MWFFSRKYKILETPFFEGFKDFHNHTLPAVDDGIKNIEKSLAVLSYFESLGVAEVVLTPHVMVNINETSEVVEARYRELKELYQGSIKLSLASEYMLDTNFNTQLSSGNIRQIEGEGLLVETSYVSPPSQFREMLYSITEMDINPIIAHPERYLYMKNGNFHSLKERDYSLQLNLLSLSGVYGEKAVTNAIYMLENSMYDYIGSDLHSLGVFRSRIKSLALSRKHIDLLLELKG